MPKTSVTFLLDRTGSMESIKDDTMGAFNAYLDGLKAAPDTDFTLVQFDSMGLDKVCVRVAPKVAPRLDKDNYQPRASTPLIDAAYKTITAVGDKLNGEKDTQVVICIQTDGQENCSTQYTWADLNTLIKEKSGLGWQFNFMGASIDAYEQGSKMGISAAGTMSYDSLDAAATQSAFESRASATVAYAAGARADMHIGAAEKQAAGDVFDPALKGPAPYSKTAPAATPRPQYTKPTITQVKAPSFKPKPAVDDFKL